MLLRVLAVVFAAVSLTGRASEDCGVFEGEFGRIVDRKDPFEMGSVRRDGLNASDPLPGRLRLVNLKPVGLRSGSCPADYFRFVLEKDHLRFYPTERLITAGADVCTFRLDLEKLGESCSSPHPTSYLVKYNILNEESLPVFDRPLYLFQVNSTVSPGAMLNGTEIAARVDSRIELQGSRALKVVEKGRRGNFVLYDVSTVEELVLFRESNLSLIAVRGPGNGSAVVTLRPASEPATPHFERNFYNVTVPKSTLRSGMDMFPAGAIKTGSSIVRPSFSLLSLGETDLQFEVVQGKDGVNLRLGQLPARNFTPGCLLFRLTASVRDSFGNELENSTSLYIRIDNSSPSVANSNEIFDSDNVRDLKIAVVTLSTAVVLLLLLLIYGYFKYVCRKNKEPPKECEKCTDPPMKYRRPTPRRICEYPYPLEVLPPPLETLTETDVEDEGEEEESRGKTTVKNESAVAKTRKRSVTFRESDDESRQNREELVRAAERIEESRRNMEK